MDNIHKDHIISMTELQKLSLKKLRMMRFPLFVLDKKSKGKGFVIQALGQEPKITLKKPVKILDYKKMGLLWDHPTMTHKSFHEALKNPKHPEHVWVARRFLERAPSSIVKNILSLDELKGMLDHIKLKPYFQEAWEDAIHYWTDNP